MTLRTNVSHATQAHLEPIFPDSVGRSASAGDLLTFSDATKRFEDGTIAVDNISFSVPAGQFCVLLGASGAGKSTLLRLINGMVVPTSGRIFFDDLEIKKANLKRIQPRLAMIHQQFHLVGRASVLDNVLAGALPKVSTLRSWLHLFPPQYQRKACHLLAQVGLSETHLYRRAMNLSGGQQQRVAIARAFLLDPALVLADEPVASLDPSISHTILSLLKERSRETGTTVLCSLHQVELALHYADRVIGMRGGRIIFDGPPAAFDAVTQESLYADTRAQTSSPSSSAASDVLQGHRSRNGQSVSTA